ncbi:MAG: hypothetical protein JWM68_2061 [Verrucomicrobiales bacterium]|nr:hypothetical protein [Verrucomicrobiales bacterium]
MPSPFLNRRFISVVPVQGVVMQQKSEGPQLKPPQFRGLAEILSRLPGILSNRFARIKLYQNPKAEPCERQLEAEILVSFIPQDKEFTVTVKNVGEEDGAAFSINFDGDVTSYTDALLISKNRIAVSGPLFNVTKASPANVEDYAREQVRQMIEEIIPKKGMGFPPRIMKNGWGFPQR